ncbi:hypothetical protein T01_5891 [Trichinella spiralis]|uniref:Uncharacterized protein n=1 Tax=Trichinella spiralis TaxID=6334 RepID=A0A0V1BV82_TRISP|nr:hypothetical protein T01_5891 [Trichinella spiralis]
MGSFISHRLPGWLQHEQPVHWAGDLPCGGPNLSRSVDSPLDLPQLVTVAPSAPPPRGTAPCRIPVWVLVFDRMEIHVHLTGEQLEWACLEDQALEQDSTSQRKVLGSSSSSSAFPRTYRSGSLAERTRRS